MHTDNMENGRASRQEINGGAVPDTNPMVLENAFKKGMGCWSHLDEENMHTNIMGNG